MCSRGEFFSLKRKKIVETLANSKLGHKGVKEQIMFHSPHQSLEAYEKEKAMENLK
jgi:hypothetical protein